MFRRVVAHVRRQPVAFVALFFAITGTGFAGTNYLAVRDPVPRSHLSGSNYGNRLAANEAITHSAHRGRPPGRPRRVRGAAPGLGNVFATAKVRPVSLGVGLGTDSTTIVSKENVPAGNYVVNAKTSVFAVHAAPRTVRCEIFTSLGGGTQIDESDTTLENEDSERAVPLQATITLDDAATVWLGCSAGSGDPGNVWAQFSQLNLTQVGDIN